MAEKKPTARKKTATKRSTVKKTSAKKPAKKRTSGKKFIRNLYGSPFRIRLERHGKDGKPINLKPRGQRGDLVPIERGDLTDPDLITNAELGVIEIITEAEALAVVHKQGTNQQAPHPALAALRNELGEEYDEDAVRVVPSDEERGTVVATVDGNNVTRVRQRGQEPGAPEGAVGIERTHSPANEDPAYLSDLKARQKNKEGPEAGLGNIQRVVVAPPEQS